MRNTLRRRVVYSRGGQCPTISFVPAQFHGFSYPHKIQSDE